LILEIVAMLVAISSVGVTLLVASRLSSRIRALESIVRQRVPSVLDKAEGSFALAGMRIRLSVRQDHARPLFANSLREALLREDVQDVLIVGDPSAHGAAKGEWLISGTITCNGYSDVYFNADLTCTLGEETVCSWSHRPPQGDRPENLVLEIVSTLTSKLADRARKNERRKALSELGD
jgi:hypothetical protein